MRNRKAEVGGFTPREARRVPVELEDDELTLYQDVNSYLRESYNQARAKRNTALGFVMVTYQKMLASSSNAVKQSFRRRIAKLKGQLNDAAAAAKPVSENRLEELRDAEEATTALTELESAADPGGLLLEIKQLEDLVERLGHVHDSKAETLLTALDAVSVTTRRRRWLSSPSSSRHRSSWPQP